MRSQPRHTPPPALTPPGQPQRSVCLTPGQPGVGVGGHPASTCPLALLYVLLLGVLPMLPAPKSGGFRWRACLLRGSSSSPLDPQPSLGRPPRVGPCPIWGSLWGLLLLPASWLDISLRPTGGCACRSQKAPSSPSSATSSAVTAAEACLPSPSYWGCRTPVPPQGSVSGSGNVRGLNERGPVCASVFLSINRAIAPSLLSRSWPGADTGGCRAPTL